MHRTLVALAVVAGCLGACGPGDTGAGGTGRAAAGAPDDVPPEYAYLFGHAIGYDEIPAVLERLPYWKVELGVFSPWIWGGDRITLWRDGRAEFVDREGRWSGKVSVFEYGRLCYLMDHVDLRAMQSTSAEGLFDASTITVRAWPEGEDEPFVLEDYGDLAPIDAWSVRAAIRGVAHEIRWELEAEDPDPEGDPDDGR